MCDSSNYFETINCLRKRRHQTCFQHVKNESKCNLCHHECDSNLDKYLRDKIDSIDLSYELRFARLVQYAKDRYLPVRECDPASKMQADRAFELAIQMISESLAHKLDVSKYQTSKITWSFETNVFPPPNVSILSMDHGSPVSLSLPMQGQREKLQKSNTLVNLTAEWTFSCYENDEIKSRHMVVGHFISMVKHHRSFFFFAEDKLRKIIREKYPNSRIDEDKCCIVLDNCYSEQKNKFFFCSLKFANFPRAIYFKVESHGKSRIDSHHRKVREGANYVNSQYKGFEHDSLAIELNKKEVTDRAERRQRGNYYLDRYYFSIPDKIDEFSIPDQKSTVRFNISDCKTAFYNNSDDSLYLAASRCGCSTCITKSFLECKETLHMVHKYNMGKINSKKTFPHPSPANFLSTDAKPKIISKSKTEGLSQPVKVEPEISIKVDTPKDNVVPDKNQYPEDLPRNRNEIFSFTKTVSHINLLNESRKLTCDLSHQEIKRAKTAMQSSMVQNFRLGHSFDDPKSPFKPNMEYTCGDLDYICNRFRNHSRMSNGPNMISRHGERSNSIDIMNSATFNSLIRIMLSQSFESSNDLITHALDQFPNGMPKPNFESLIIAVFCTTGMKKTMKAGHFQYDDKPGHYITLHLKMSSSSVFIYDHMNLDIKSSHYFDFACISKVVQAIHDYFKNLRNESVQPLTFHQHTLRQQSGVDCGPHCLANIELILHQLDPAKQVFDKETMKQIRNYHFLIRELMLSEFRVSLC